MSLLPPAVPRSRLTTPRAAAAPLGSALLLGALMLASAAVPAWAQRTRAARAATVADTTTRSDPALHGLRWRLVGPFRGGRVVAVAGDPVNRQRFWFGAVDGGVWRTDDGGLDWRNVTDGTSAIASVGAIAVAPSDPNVIWVGSGEADFREDFTYGDGIWRSTDGGEHWTHLGLDDARHIAAIRVDPHDPDVAYVAAMGHGFGPNAMRGVYRTRDGGKTWQRVLFIDDGTGAIDIALDPNNPRILFAAMWKFQRFPWGFSAGGGQSGLFRSTDGGDTWTDISARPGLPKSILGRIGVSVSPANSRRIYATVEAPDSTGGIFRSDDGGDSWQRVNADQTFMVRPWYFSFIAADPKDENTVYVLNLGTWKSVDGGKTFSRLRAPHGDDHTLWVDPDDPDRMIEGNDGGATISFDGGESWSTQDNQPTAQFYHVITDDQFPYRIYGAQQDNSTVSIPSRSDNGAITPGDWWAVAGGESGYIAPDPLDPNVAYAGSYMGTVTRYDHRTNQAQDVAVWLDNWDGYASADVPYRFQWTFPIVFSPHDPHALYVTSQYVFRTTDGGMSWEKLSPDLTLHDPKTMGPVGGPITRDMTGTEWYATIFAFAESPVQTGVMWAGSDDGLIHLSRDGGKTWTDVTPKDMAHFTRVSIIEPSHHDAGTAYVAANRYQLDDFHPYLYRTTDYGKTWTRIDAGIPVGAYTRTIREDPARRGLLYAGTETGIYVSFDDGAHWQSLQLNLPRTSVRDLTIHGNDLIAATHGRAFWSLDDITPLRELADSVRRADVFLFAVDTALRWQGGSYRTDDAGRNPPDGVIVDYWLREAPKGPVTLSFLDPKGQVIRIFTSTGEPADTTAALASRDSAAGDTGATARGATQRDTAAVPHRQAQIEHAADTASYEPSDSVVSARAGANRFVWNLRYPGAQKAEDIVVDEGTLVGPQAAPGTYTVRLTVDGKSSTRPFVVVEDPRVKATTADLEAERDLALQVRDEIDRVVGAARRIAMMEDQLDAWTARAKGQAYASRVASAAGALKPKLERIRGQLVEVHSHADEITLHFPIVLYNKLLSLNYMVQSADARPTTQQYAVLKDLSAQVDRELAALDALEKGELASFNGMIRDLNVPAVGATEKR